jgi:hypothetical protein
MIKQNSEKNYLDIIFGLINVLLMIGLVPRNLQLLLPAFFALFCVGIYGSTKYVSKKIRQKINKSSDAKSGKFLSIIHIILFAVILILS